ncbi:TauD/TfdA family dioxygenase [Paraburkholderia phytofirmans]|uniref:TauD/TfdA family dioxygenase n=1 Tax=Paraburkholderia phytofirmans TaxID=261302 RepID=UPI0038B7A7F3
MTSSYQFADGWPSVAKTGWTAASFDTSKAVHHFEKEELELLLALVDRTKAKGIDVAAITRDDFDHPELHDVLESRVRELKYGQGLAILGGFPVRQRPLEDVWRMYWGIGSHFGVGVSQNTRGDLLGKVTVTPGTVGGRVYGSSGVAPLHSDRIDMLSLLCVNKAKRGGENVFVSSLAVWDLVQRERPDLFDLLRRGYPQHRNNEQAEGDSPVTPYRVPVFGERDGLRSVYFGGNAMLAHQEKHFAEILTSRDREALSYLAQVVLRPELGVRQMLEPGEAVFINNMELLHSRTAFEDGSSPNETRLLLRMWLGGRPQRPKPNDMTVVHNRSGCQGVWAKQSAPA